MELYPVVLAGRPLGVDREPPRWLSVSRDNWPILIELGAEFGWQAEGTRADDDRSETCGSHVPTYEIQFAPCASCVTARDARDWAAALDRALSGAGTASQRRKWNEALADRLSLDPGISASALVAAFSEFLKCGEFAFYVTD